ncbi:MAG: zinc ribbon domain-containing protein [Deltaproteobacteria bacterium]|jgi:hypothetical protein|nr:zinc ribbon domain-containing protein [Deltaproteobacteria bacterium]
MPYYCYEHLQESPHCERHPGFEVEQPIRDLPLQVCPWCGAPVKRVLGASLIKSKNLDCELRDKGFTKLVRVDDGLYENKTRRPGEEKYVDRRRPETLPRLEKTIRD